MKKVMDLPNFDIDVDNMYDYTVKATAINKKDIIYLLESTTDYTWDNFVQVLNEMDEESTELYGAVGHLNGVLDNKKLREEIDRLIPINSEFGSWYSQNVDIYNAYKHVYENDKTLCDVKKKVLENVLRGYETSGIHLPADEKEKLTELSLRGSELGTKFSNNLTDAIEDWTKHITDETLVADMPETWKAFTAHEDGGYMVTLHSPSVQGVLTYSSNRELRKEVYMANVSKASPLTADGKFDNSDVVKEIMEVRGAKAKILGQRSYADLSLVPKMADSPEEVVTFLESVLDKASAPGKAQYDELKEYAKTLGIKDMKAWDIGYVAEKLQKEKYDISQEDLRPYFPHDHVVNGMFNITKTLFDVNVVEDTTVETYHEDVSFYKIFDGEELIAGFFLDMFARSGKRPGAWMADCTSREVTSDGVLHLPIAYLTCNFTPKTDGVSLLTHDEVTTLFHEFGHGLQHMLTEVDVSGVSGISGVEWDAVELPSQFMENWCWKTESLALISKHNETGETLPKELFDKLTASKNFLGGMGLLRQLEFSLFDMTIHQDVSDDLDVRGTLNAIRDRVAVSPTPEENYFENSFGHIFAGGYSAGYYSYMWALALSCDAFSKFEDNVFDKQMGMKFRSKILATGGSKPAKELFKEFMGRDLDASALMTHYGF